MPWLGDVYYFGHPDNDTELFEEFMARDDPELLHDYVQAFVKGFPDNYRYSILLGICFDRLATKCARYIIQGNLPHGHPDLTFDPRQRQPDHPFLYYVIHLMCEPGIFHHLLYNCNAATQVNQLFLGLLPIHWLLDLLLELPPFSYWSPGQSLSTVIDSLFLPEIRPTLECARMVAQHTHSLDQIALGYIHNGEIIPLAALLLLTPFTKGDFETLKSHTSSIASQAIHDQSVTPSTYCAAAALLSIFEKHGEKLTYKFHNEHKPAGVVAEVLSMDVDLTDVYSNSNHPEMLKSTCERLGIKIDDTTQIGIKSPFPSVKSVNESYTVEVPSVDFLMFEMETMGTCCEGLDDEA